MLIELLKGAVVGGTIGWATNQLAVWMLFHPKQALRVGGFAVPLTPGLVVRNQERLAEAIASAVSRDLLDPETLHAHFAELRLEDAVRAALLEERARLATIDEPIAARLGPEHAGALARVQDHAARAIAARLAGFAEQLEERQHVIAHALEAVLADALALPIDTLLPGQARGGLAHALAQRVGAALREPEQRAAIEPAVAGAVRRLARSESFGELTGTLQEWLRPKLPAATTAIQQSLGNFIVSKEFEDAIVPKARAKLYEVIIQKFPMAAMMLTEPMLEELLRQKWPDLAAEVKIVVGEEKLLAFLSTQLEDSAGSLLVHAADMIDDEANALRATQWLLDRLAANDEGAIEGLIERGIELAAPRSLGEILGSGEEMARALAPVLARQLAGWLRSEAGRAWAEERARELLGDLLQNEPIRDLVGLLPEEEWALAGDVAANALQQRAAAFLPKLITEQMDLHALVVAKVRQFDSDRIEETIKRVSGRELKGIVRLGGLIGILVGASVPLIDYTVRWMMGS